MGNIQDRQEGEKKGRIEVTLNLIKVGLDIEIIAQTTKLSIDEIKKLAKKH